MTGKGDRLTVSEVPRTIALKDAVGEEAILGSLHGVVVSNVGKPVVNLEAVPD